MTECIRCGVFYEGASHQCSPPDNWAILHELKEIRKLLEGLQPKCKENV